MWAFAKNTVLVPALFTHARVRGDLLSNMTLSAKLWRWAFKSCWPSSEVRGQKWAHKVALSDFGGHLQKIQRSCRNFSHMHAFGETSSLT